jgi:signal peptidase I
VVDATPTKLRRFWREWIRPILIVVVVLCTFRSAIADWNDVPTGSMKPTILEGDRIFVNKLAYDLKFPFTRFRLATWDDPARGDVVILFSPVDGTRLVKRVVAIPGDELTVRDNRLWINGAPAEYGPLDTDTISQIEPDEQPSHRFFSERLTGRAHPMMTTPGRPSPDRNRGPVVLGADEYFVMGDNRDDSGDSRKFGIVMRDRIVGRSSRIAFSLDPAHYYLPRWDRFFRDLP